MFWVPRNGVDFSFPWYAGEEGKKMWTQTVPGGFVVCVYSAVQPLSLDTTSTFAKAAGSATERCAFMGVGP